MVTSLGKLLKLLRLENGELLKDMADKTGIASSTLSSIECGRRRPPSNFSDKIRAAYDLTEEQLNKLQDAIGECFDSVTLSLNELDSKDRKTAVMFARRFAELPDEDKAKIEEIFNAS